MSCAIAEVELVSVRKFCTILVTPDENGRRSENGALEAREANATFSAHFDISFACYFMRTLNRSFGFAERVTQDK